MVFVTKVPRGGRFRPLPFGVLYRGRPKGIKVFCPDSSKRHVWEEPVLTCRTGNSPGRSLGRSVPSYRDEVVTCLTRGLGYLVPSRESGTDEREIKGRRVSQEVCKYPMDGTVSESIFDSCDTPVSSCRGRCVLQWKLWEVGG